MSFYTGGDAARTILDAHGIKGVLVVCNTRSVNEYDPRRRVISLSYRAFNYQTPEAIAIGAHEAGHAIQHDGRCCLFMVRAKLFPFARLCSTVLPACLLIAALFHMHGLLVAVLWAYAVLIAFHLLALPIEYDASHRAYIALIQNNIVAFGSDESIQIQKLLRGLLWGYAWSFLLSPLWLLASLFKRGHKR